MTSPSEGLYAKGVEHIAEQLRQEFLDETAESLQVISGLIDQVHAETASLPDLINVVRRAALQIRGQAANFQLHHLGVVARRMEDYLANVKNYPPRTIDDIQHFNDTLLDILEGRIVDEGDESKLVRGLPAKLRFDESDIVVRDIEVLLVMLHGAQTHFVEREMQECGYRISTCTSTFEALPLIVRTKPDLVIVSAIMSELSGIDLAIGMAAMPATRNVPCALITSLPEDDEYLALLPEKVPVIRKSAAFGDDLAEALSRLFLI